MDSTISDKDFSSITHQELIELGRFYEECVFRNCIWIETDLSSMTFIDCQFIDCDLTMSMVTNTALQSINFANCKMMGVRFHACKSFLLEMSFESCKMDFSSFQGLKGQGLKFNQCSLVEADFINADLRNVQLTDCNLEGAQFENTLLDFANLTDSVGIDLDPEINFVKGVKVSMSSLPGLLTKYQLNIQ